MKTKCVLFGTQQRIALATLSDGPFSLFLGDKVFRTVHNTRESGHNLLLPKLRTEMARKSFYFNGSKLFNNIASEMKDSKSVVIFKTHILELYRSKVF